MLTSKVPHAELDVDVPTLLLQFLVLHLDTAVDVLEAMITSSSAEASTAASLIEALNTPGGYNQRLRQHMEAAGTGATLNEGLTKLETGS